MNVDFNLGNSSGVARRIVKLSEICDIVVDPSIVEKSEQGLLDQSVQENYNLNNKEVKAIQSIIDFGFRCVVPGYENEKAALVALISSNIFPIIIFTNKIRRLYWHKFITKEYPNLKIDENIFIVTKIDEDFITEENRAGAVIIDTNSSYLISSENISFSMDFEKIIIVCQNKKMNWIEYAEILFPNSFSDLVKGYVSPYHQKELVGMHFNSGDSNDYLFLFNIVTDLAEPS